jgi:hypothetical protein
MFITTSYFKSKNGLRKDDLLSHFLFNLVENCLSKMLQKAKVSRYIKGVGKFKDDNLTNFNFANDILFFISANTRMIDTIEQLLIAFENLSGLRINFKKSELVLLSIAS